MTDEEARADFQGDPSDIPVGWMIFSGGMVLVALALLTPFAFRWLMGQS